MKELKLLLALSLVFVFASVSGQNKGLWSTLNNTAKKTNGVASYEVGKRKLYQLNISELKSRLKQSPLRKKNNQSHIVLDFPMPDGSMESFEVYETPVLSTILSEKYPTIKSYTGRSPENPLHLIKFTLTDFGFHGMILRPEGEAIYINPEQKETHTYEVFSRKELSAKAFACHVHDMKEEIVKDDAVQRKVSTVNDGNLRTFRLALAATGEYTQFHANAAGVGDGTDAERRAAALAAMNVTMARVNGIFETEMSITMVIVPNNEDIIFTDPETDGLSNNSGGTLINEIQNVIDFNIGFPDYDIGHVFSTGGGGIAQLNSPCGSGKARGVTGLPSPVGDPFDVDYVCHEMGHQYGATHTFNNACNGNRSEITSVEPGSGTTIMAYTGICPPNIQSQANPNFHAVSIQQMWNNISGGVSTCASLSPTGNNAPTADAGNDYIIPAATPFVLEGQGNDIDGDALTYAWEQTDTEIAAQPPVATSSGGPTFLALSPTTSPNRYIPQLPSILAGNLSPTWEVLPEVSREINFSLMVRDNNLNGGQTDRDDMHITVTDNAGPFTVTSQPMQETWEAGEVHTVTWDVANTDIAPVNASRVTIILYTDTDFQNSVILADSVINDGSHNIIVPGGIDTTTGRIMIRPVDNIFFSINAADITINQSEYVLSFTSLEQTACQPNDAAFNFTYNNYLGFSDMTDFTAVDVPAGLSVNFNPPSAMNNDTNVDVTVTNTGAVAEGDYTFTVRATSGAHVRDYEIALSVYDLSFNDANLMAPTDVATGIFLRPQFQWQSVDFAEEYTFEISEVSDFSVLVESVVTRRLDYTPLTNLQPNTTHYWRVKPMNSCGEGTFSNAFSFTTTPVECRTFANNNVISISTNGTPIVTSAVTVIDDLPVNRVTLSLDLTHTWLGDLRATLTSPSGTVVNLISNVCGEGDNINANFDDEGSAISCGGFPAISGTVRPEQQLSAFEGESAQGEWILTIYDDFNLDGGSLNSFSLDVCVNGEFPPDEDSDGVTDANDDCLGTPPGETVGVNGCPVFTLPPDNFTIDITSETCIPSNDASVSIAANQTLNYTANFTGNGLDLNQSFTDDVDFLNLSAGTYTLCLTVDSEPEYEQCYDIVITEPDPLVVQSKVDTAGKTVTVEMQGSDFYNVELNGLITQTTEDKITLTLKPGINILKVTTDKECQGSYEKEIVTGNDILIYPNPVTTGILTIDVTNRTQESVTVKIYSISGKMVYNELFREVVSPIYINIADLPVGPYLINITGTQIKSTQKIVKL